MKPAVDPPGTTRVEESIQHGFFGDLSRPAPPALNRVQGIRVPDADKSPASEQPQAAPSAKPVAEPPAHVYVPLPAAPLPPEAATGAAGIDNAGAKPETSVAPAEQSKPRSD